MKGNVSLKPLRKPLFENLETEFFIIVLKVLHFNQQMAIAANVKSPSGTLVHSVSCQLAVDILPRNSQV